MCTKLHCQNDKTRRVAQMKLILKIKFKFSGVHGAVVRTTEYEPGDLGSNPGRYRCLYLRKNLFEFQIDVFLNVLKLNFQIERVVVAFNVYSVRHRKTVIINEIFIVDFKNKIWMG